MLQLRAEPAVRSGQGMEGKGCIQVMFGVEGHVPHLPSHYRIREGCAGVGGASSESSGTSEGVGGGTGLGVGSIVGDS